MSLARSGGTIPTSAAGRNDGVTVLLHFYAMWARCISLHAGTAGEMP
jgi:hypothetical protein